MPYNRIWVHLVWATKDRIPLLTKEIRRQNIATIIQLLKGESSFWINKQKLTSVKFGWQDEYFAVSACESQIEILRNYIRNQEEHHKKKTFANEYDEFIKKYGFEIIHKDKK